MVSRSTLELERENWAEKSNGNEITVVAMVDPTGTSRVKMALLSSSELRQEG